MTNLEKGAVRLTAENYILGSALLGLLDVTGARELAVADAVRLADWGS